MLSLSGLQHFFFFFYTLDTGHGKTCTLLDLRKHAFDFSMFLRRNEEKFNRKENILQCFLTD